MLENTEGARDAGCSAGQMPAHHESHQHACSCIGVCATPAIGATPDPVVIQVAALSEPRRAAWPLIEARNHSIAATDFLPLSTAPPLA